MSHRKKVTIYDIAADVGVAPSTVSRALSRPDRVSADTAARIFATAERLGYSRVGATYSGDAHLSNTLVLVVADLANPFYEEISEGFQRAAGDAGYTTIILNTQESSALEQQTIQQIIARVDGVALAASRLDAGSIKKIEKQRPLVLLNRYMKGHTCVIPETERGLAKVFRYLSDLGHRSVLYISGPEMSWANAIRWRVASQTAPKYGLTLTRTDYVSPDPAGGAEAFVTWNTTNRTSAVLAFNDLTAAGFMREARAHQVRIPQDVSVVGIDNSSLTTLVYPELSSLASASQEIGKRGAESLIWQVTHRSSRERKLLQLPIEFIPRASTGPAKTS